MTLVTAREAKDSQGVTIYIASAPGAQDMLARMTEEAAIADGAAYFQRHYLNANVICTFTSCRARGLYV